MARGSWTLDPIVHAKIVENACKITQLEWAKLLAWAPVVEGMRRWTSTVLLVVIASGYKGITVKVASEMMGIDVQNIRFRFLLLENYHLISSRYEGTKELVYRQRLPTAPWPEWVIPPTWALKGLRTKPTSAKPLKELYKLKVKKGKAKICKKRRGRIYQALKWEGERMDRIIEYHKQRAEAEELVESQEKSEIEELETKKTESEILQEFDTGFESVELKTKKVKKKDLR